MSKNKWAVMPYTHYEAACNKIREKTGKTEPILSGELEAEIDTIGVNENGLIEKTITHLENHTATKVGFRLFFEAPIQTAKLYNATTIELYAFYKSQLKEIVSPKVTSIGNYAFNLCQKLTELNFPELLTTGDHSFWNCTNVERIYIPKIQKIVDSYQMCCSLKALIIKRTDGVVPLSSSRNFRDSYHLLGTVNSTYNPEGLKDGYIYVPRTMVDSYKSATNWIEFQDQIRAIEDYPEILEGLE